MESTFKHIIMVLQCHTGTVCSQKVINVRQKQVGSEYGAIRNQRLLTGRVL